MNSGDELFAQHGFSVHEAVLSEDLRPAVLEVLSHLRSRQAGSRAGLSSPAIAALAVSDPVRLLVEPVLGPGAFAYRATLFDKHGRRNWPVAWHQDRVVPVASRVEAPGYQNWSQKAGGVYVEPPRSVQEQCVAIRIDLDGSGPDNGGLQICPGSHQQGVLAADAIPAALQAGVVVCPKVVAGGALRMRPLLLHRSGRSVAAGHRRIVHVEFCSHELPGGPRFAHRIGPGSE